MIRFLFLGLLWYAFAFGGQPAVFYLLKDAAEVRILNKYEQDTRETFLPGTAFQVTEQNYMLSDGITPAWEARLGGKTYFLLPLDEASKLLRNCTILQDTVQLIKDRLTIDLADGSKQVLHKGQILQRLFQKGSRTYVFAEQYGWCRLPRRAWEKVQRASITEYTVPERLQQRILNRFESVNQTYHQFFDFFNIRFQKSEPTPQWLSVPEGESLRIYLNHPGVASHLESSIAVVQKDIEQLLLGSRFICQFVDNQFIISSNSSQ